MGSAYGDSKLPEQNGDSAGKQGGTLCCSAHHLHSPASAERHLCTRPHTSQAHITSDARGQVLTPDPEFLEESAAASSSQVTTLENHSEVPQTRLRGHLWERRGPFSEGGSYLVVVKIPQWYLLHSLGQDGD